MGKWWRGLRSAATAVEIDPPASLFRRSFSSFDRYHTIQAIPREVTGRGVATRERMLGRIPAVVFSQSLLETEASKRCGSRKQLLTADQKQIKSLLKSIGLPYFCSTTFQLQVRAGPGSSLLLESGRVLPLKIHRDEKTGEILNLVFVRAEDGEQLKVDIPVAFKGLENCPGLKKGGHLRTVRSSLKFLCPAEQIPSKIEVDVSNLDIEDKVLLRDIKVHPSLKLLSAAESLPICKIVASNPPAEPEAVLAS
ncbi:PREDICTED: uncharacterized protein LOC104827055 [Tarenaya hassleriana]|uniref:uncharacterized protein LOC104827055 n=1 Tax=Tarenaya hassleriana TaxID=28532 RepID=UPI00053C5E02|nr:PREDICTED: uncharacterized protein LOC104827055 [Tarenaya hassleriana]